MRHTFWPPRLGVGDSGKRSQQVSVAEPSSGWALRPQTEPAFRDGNLPHWGFFSIDTQLVLRQTWGLSWIFKTYPFALVLLISCKSVQNSKTLTLNFSQFFGNIKKNILRKVEQILNKDKSMRLRQLGTVLGSWPRKDKTYTVSCDNLFPPKFSKESRDLACLPMIWKANHVLERLFLTLSLKAWQSDHRKEPNAVMGFSDGFPKVLASWTWKCSEETPIGLPLSIRPSGCSREDCFQSCRPLTFFLPSVPCKVCMGQSPCYFQSWFSNQKKTKTRPKSWEPQTTLKSGKTRVDCCLTRKDGTF